jgi:diguanylate cyclase (GGDEF)-like protein
LEQSYKELLSKSTILLVDDEENLRDSIKSFLEEYVKDIIVAENGEQGLILYKKHKPDIVITDMKMPFKSGTDMVSEIKKIKQNAKIIFISSDQSIEILLKAIDSGCDQFILKPVSKKSLIKSIEKILVYIQNDKKYYEQSMAAQFILDSQENMVILTTPTEILGCNRSTLEYLGYSTFDELKDNIKSIAELFVTRDGYIVDTREKNWIDVSLNNSDKHEVIIYSNLHKKNRIFLLKVSPFMIQDNKPKYVVTFTDVTEIESVNCSNKDLISDTYSREFITNQLKNYMDYYKDGKKHFSVFLVKIENFAEYNEKYGEASGDKMLHKFMCNIKSKLNSHFMLGRLSGAKFIILAPLVDINRANIIKDNLSKSLKSIDDIEFYLNAVEYNYQENDTELIARLTKGL